MDVRHTEYLDRATAAVSRGDYLSALQYGLRAAGAPHPRTDLRCEAQILLALTSLELGDCEAALAHAIGAHLAACRMGDTEREARASAIVVMIMAQHPHLQERHAAPFH